MSEVRVVSPGVGDLILCDLAVEEGWLRSEYPEAALVSVSSRYGLYGRRVEGRVFVTKAASLNPACGEALVCCRINALKSRRSEPFEAIRLF